MCLSAAPVASALSARLSHRSVVIIGGLICSTGVITGTFARNLTELYFTVGFLNGKWFGAITHTHIQNKLKHTNKMWYLLSSFSEGFGYALTWTPTVTMLGLYFEKRRPVANALASAGECVLTFVFTPLFQLLVDSFSWRGAFLILGGLQLNLCVCGMLLRPLEGGIHVTHVSEVKAEEGGLSLQLLPKEALEQKKANSLEEEQRISEGSDQCAIKKPHNHYKHPKEKSPVTKNSNSSYRKNELRFKILHYVDYTLIANARFMVYSMFGVFAALGFFAPALFLIPYARSKGIEEYQAAALMSISAVLDLFGRVFFGWVANLRLVATVSLV